MSDLHQFIDRQRGFLPPQDPLIELPPALAADCAGWISFAQNLPKWLMSDNLRQACAALPAFPTEKLTNPREQEYAMVLLSFIGHAFVWGNQPAADSLPENLAQAWVAVAELVGRPPVLSYASYALHNWHRLDPDGPIALGNIALKQNFLGGQDEEWFVLVHIDIEAKAGPMLDALCDAVLTDSSVELTDALSRIAKIMQTIDDVMERMPERCDPYIYYQRVRPYIHGWKDNPALPEGLLYSGVARYQNQRQFFRGETGAQSSIMPALDAALGIYHETDPLKVYLNEMREYMPAPHQAFLTALAQQSKLRAHVEASQQADLTAAYNDCIAAIDRFRQIHLKFAADYIQKQNQTSSANPTETGTGGTPFMRYLRKHEQETTNHNLR